MKKYEWILFDADDTLFNYDAYAGLQVLFTRLGVDFTVEDYEEYEALNQPLWVDYQNGTITSLDLQSKRFELWAERLNIPALNLNSDFMLVMADICVPLDGVRNLLDRLKGKAKLGIITNGFAEMQLPRLRQTGFENHFDLLVVSEEVGVAKPDKRIFEHALEKMGRPDPQNVLMVGDNPASDILGGINAGLDTCWLNVNNKPLVATIAPKVQVASYQELEAWLAPYF